MSDMKTTNLLKLVIVVFLSLCATHVAAGQNNKQPEEKGNSSGFVD